MSAPDPKDAVFIDQMPDYKVAREKLAELTQHEAKFTQVVQELGFSQQFNTMKQMLDKLDMQAVQVIEQKKLLDPQIEQKGQQVVSSLKKGTIISTIIAAIAGIGTGIAVGKWKSAWKGVFAGLGATIVSGITSMVVAAKVAFGSKKEALGLQQQVAMFDMKMNELSQQAMQIEMPFMEALTARMLHQQKMLVGEGADMKLVSTVQPKVEVAPVVAASTQTAETASAPAGSSMAQKYATAPAASQLAAAVDRREAAAQSPVVGG